METKKEYRVYKVTNLRNNKIYIGQTSRNIFSRLISHGHQKNSPLYADMQAQELKDFNISLIAVFDTKMKAMYAEKKYILEHKSYLPEIGYNEMIGFYHAEKTKKKIQKTSKKRMFSEEQLIHIQLMGLARKGVKASEETKKKLSESHLGQAAWNKGKKLSSSHVESLKKSLTGRKLSNAHKEAIRQGHLKRKLNG